MSYGSKVETLPWYTLIVDIGCKQAAACTFLSVDVSRDRIGLGAGGTGLGTTFIR